LCSIQFQWGWRSVIATWTIVVQEGEGGRGGWRKGCGGALTERVGGWSWLLRRGRVLVVTRVSYKQGGGG